jgi:hypothetical protein
MLWVAAGLTVIAAVIMLVDALGSGAVASWVTFGFMVVAACFFVACARGWLGNRPKGELDESADRPRD